MCAHARAYFCFVKSRALVGSRYGIFITFIVFSVIIVPPSMIWSMEMTQPSLALPSVTNTMSVG
jgi:hypothetical protein